MSFAAGRKLGTYEIVEPLGSGGMGEVYRARDSRLKREVAIKVMSDKFSNNAEHGSRFRSEALILASLNHPNIAAIYGLEEYSGQQLLVMELVEGETFAELLLSRGSIPVGEALALCTQVAEGLEAAHLKRITHRDVKPSNIKVTPEGRVKVLDFGLGKTLRNTTAEQNLSQLTTVTVPSYQSGAIVGTPSYMSPEQARGKPVDQRTDIWAFGCLLFELLTGKRAFRGETTSDTIAAILERQPDWQRLPSATPENIKELLRKCLQKNADLRPPSMRDVIEEIEKGKAKLRGWPITRRKAIAAVAALAIIPIALLAWPNVERVWRSLTLPKQKNVAVIPFRCIGGNAGDQTFCDGLTETVTTALSKHGEISVVPAISSRHIETAEQARKELFVNLVVSGTVERRSDTVRLTLSVTDAAKNRLIRTEPIDWPVARLWKIEDAVVERFEDLLNLPPAKETDSVLVAANSQVPGVMDAYLRGLGYLNRFDRPGNLASALREFGNATSRDPDFALAYVGIAETHLRMYRTDTNKTPEALLSARLNAELAQKLNTSLATPHVVLGGIWNELGKPEEAIRELEIARKLDPRDPSPNRELGLLYYRQKRYKDADEVYNKAMKQRPGDWLIFRSAASYYSSTYRQDEAERYFREVIRLTPDNDEGYRNLGGVLLKVGREKEAEEALLTAVRLNPTISALTNLGYLYIQQHLYTKAVAVMKQAATLDKKKKNYKVWGNLGDAYWLANNLDQANDAWRQAVAIVQEELKTAVEPAELLGFLAKFEAKSGESLLAEQHIEAAIKKSPDSADIRYQASIVYALIDRKDLAIDQIASALNLKYSPEEIQQAPELETLHGVPRYKELFASPLAKQ